MNPYVGKLLHGSLSVGGAKDNKYSAPTFSQNGPYDNYDGNDKERKV